MKKLPPVHGPKTLKRLHPKERQYAKRHTQEYLTCIVGEAAEHIYDVMKDPNMPPDLRLRAAFDIMDRSMGKPVNKVEQKVLDETEERREMPDLQSVPTQELESILDRLSSFTDGNASVEQITDETPDFDFDD
jgi:hypothetical protein